MIKAKAQSIQTHRHTAAFVLLFLAKEGELYGAAILKTLREGLPCYTGDTAAIYRALQELEEAGCVKARWETDVGGPARRWYSVTAKGRRALASFKDDMLMRKRNFDRFVELYGELNSSVKGKGER